MEVQNCLKKLKVRKYYSFVIQSQQVVEIRHYVVS